MAKQKLVMIGNGMAGVRTIEDLIKENPDAYEITIFGKEPHPNYNRIQLSNVLQGDMSIEDIILNQLDWYETNKIQLFTGETVVDIDLDNKEVISDQGQRVAYDKLIFATGSSPFFIPVEGIDKQGIIGFRDVSDCEVMIKGAEEYQDAVVIGGGLLGLEAAKGLKNLGMNVSVVHLMPHLMERQLDAAAGAMLKQELEKQGINFLMEKQTVEVLGDERATGLRFKDGSEVKANLVVMAVGIVPNKELAQQAGIVTNRGIIVNDFMETNIEDHYAIGECAEHRGIAYGLVAPLYEQAKVLAKRLANVPTEPYEGSVTGTQLKVAGVDLYSAGEIEGDDQTKAIRVHNEFEGVYKKVLIRDNHVVGTVLYGETTESTRLFRMLSNKEDVRDMTSLSILQAAGEAEEDDVAAMADEVVVCGCNGVTKKTVVDAIHAHNLTSVNEVGGCTNAGRSCGRCKPLIGQILEHTLGDSFDGAAAKDAICSCTTLDRDEVVAEIKEKGLTSVKEVMHVLGWKNEEGCSKCNPALNYYLGMIYADYKDERDARLVNEKMHANIQKDGTYSVVPRMYGGVTTAEDLKKLAEVATKYEVPLVKLTGGQRIGLFGIKKQDLPSVWAELGMQSGYAYGKTLRTVKTCVGARFCRYGTQDSMGLGMELEKKFERIDTPHKFKMGVSACPRNCAESGIKDIGVVGIDGGWEIYVGGNGGTDLRAGDLLYTVKTKEEVMDIASAYLQYYRETGHYLERTSKWVERMGLDHIKSVIEDEKVRRELISRIDQTLERYNEPWQEAIESDEIQGKYYRPVVTN
ncbi:nitrite reductase large subunit NirB [Aquibacillus koreensis]|uniref:Nitrite reductase large subunit NirB n=1 Tax=Aquibacillus koreensis TaxID=279446 RepID=A0A9X3WJC8_9BACI|nr:nitrite reductase large subunit NirB [Aquibacillus koreensis]MCT2536506.1 nitrite reductase large subunit NirB [Aquibacillus koreensis]MDC3419406.1 nitrite reductase large subunit NirB [Aquibacillus koreensis]